ncbi:hypothetical protein [Thermococcus thioreducens]|uniref:hypothetical protein n=1 Tax=Thermococcus thioreducens TaxID=277988 RepID=UPI0011815CED|nr:hypothetical protein [Thermococcus thioreducens]
MPMLIYHNIIHELGEKSWAKWAKWPLKKARLSFEIQPEKSERHAFILPLMKKCPQLWRSLRSISRNSSTRYLERSFLEKRWAKC